jgi:cobalt-zinc-cadmium efflux system protein
MGAGHDHGTGEISYERPLWWALGLTTTFLVAEVVGGLLTNSLALISDAAHMMTDVIALAISLIAVRLSKKPADAKRTFGYARMEAIGALINGGLLFLVAGYVLWEAIGRFRQPPEVASIGMMAIATLGLVVNLISMRLLKAGSGSSLNIKGAYLEVWSDMLGSLGVLAAAVIIQFTGWTLADPIIAVLIGLWVLPRTWVLVRSAGHILMEGVPEGTDLAAIRAALGSHPGVSGVHDLHVWALGSKEPLLTAHVVVADRAADTDAIRGALSEKLEHDFGIHHVTLQVESSGSAHDHGHA